jgi:hypothetical protein
MGQRNRLGDWLKSGWGTFVGVCLLGVFTVIGVLADLIQLQSWLTGGGAPIVWVLAAFLLIVAVVGVIREKFRATVRTLGYSVVAAFSIVALVLSWLPAAKPSPSVAEPDSTVASHPSSPAPRSSETEPVPSLTKTRYRLTPSSNPLTNDGDKVDLDTGCPGWGPTSVRVGRNRCGDLADLIVETSTLHAPNDKPRLSLVSERASYTGCHDRVDGVGVIPLDGLRGGGELCVTTDKDNIAAVHVDPVGPDGSMVIDYQLWKG